jgi:hypothetical protein
MTLYCWSVGSFRQRMAGGQSKSKKIKNKTLNFSAAIMAPSQLRQPGFELLNRFMACKIQVIRKELDNGNRGRQNP